MAESKNYDFKAIEQKWQDVWGKSGAFNAVDFSDKPKYYVLSEFFGPSGKGIHLGHVKCFTPTDVIARYKRLKGFNVLYPAGWDAFGLPTENYAIKMKLDPDEVTKDNIKIFKNQLKKLGFSFDWSREINTTDPGFYKFTQWIFLQLFKKGMAYKADGVVNYCPKCQTVLSNEDSQGGICDRCKSPVEQKKRSVWYLRMKDYSEKMLDAIDEIDLKPSLKDSQRNWIGKSEGAEILFELRSKDKSLPQKLKVFTTRPDTLYGVSYMALAPEHPLIEENSDKIKNIEEVRNYAASAVLKTSVERTADKEKTGVKLEGIEAINPVSGKSVPVFISDYVLYGYGTGAIMAVPAHDERDYGFAKKFSLDIIEVISGGNITKEAYIGDGKLINSGIINGLNTADAKKRITEFLEERGLGIKKVNYKMQDWPFNRQRYWGEPFPIVFCDCCGTVALAESDLPLTLPKMSDYSPSGDGNGPLSKLDSFVKTTCPICGREARRETDTMPNWAGSSWYWLRFMNPHNNDEFASQKNLKYWGEVDLYTGGTEHITRHMLYASFWHNFLYDNGFVPNKLPFKRRMCNGLILDDKGRKMGKSSGNAIDPIEVVKTYGADAFRLHILFMGDYEQNTVWSLEGIAGAVNFLKRLFSLREIVRDENSISKEHEKDLNRIIKRAATGIVSDCEDNCGDRMDFKFNTVIAGFMEFLNLVKKDGFITKEELRRYLIMMNPFIPHITSELYEEFFGGDITGESFPEFDENKLIDTVIEIPVQVLGKLKGKITILKDEPEESVTKKALAMLGINGAKKTIYVPNKIVNIIV